MKAKWEKGVDAMVNERREGRGSLRFIERKKEGKERKKEKSGKQQKKTKGRKTTKTKGRKATTSTPHTFLLPLPLTSELLHKIECNHIRVLQGLLFYRLRARYERLSHSIELQFTSARIGLKMD